jgi:hypothetical protein
MASCMNFLSNIKLTFLGPYHLIQPPLAHLKTLGNIHSI